MNSVGEECTELKRQYDVCFNRWFSQVFLKGRGQSSEPCPEIYRKYRDCVQKAIKRKEIPLEGFDLLANEKSQSETSS
uniref:TP53-regulated inhibitor of apoptosis 1 n=1 Tax=Myxine glutinosa TaxID=7769 RepID=UPI00358ECC1C